MERNKKLHINIWTDVGNKMTYFDGTGCFHICCTISASFCRRKQESEIKEKNVMISQSIMMITLVDISSSIIQLIRRHGCSHSDIHRLQRKKNKNKSQIDQIEFKLYLQKIIKSLFKKMCF